MGRGHSPFPRKCWNFISGNAACGCILLASVVTSIICGHWPIGGMTLCPAKYALVTICGITWSSGVPRVGRGTPLLPCPFTSSSFPLFYFSLSFIGFTCFLILSIPSLSTRIVPVTHCVVLTAVQCRVPTLTHVIRSQGGCSVNALTSLGDEVFVVRSGSRHVEVYEAVTFTLRRHITVHGLGSFIPGMAACAKHACLYLSDSINDSVHRAALAGSNAVKKWSVAGDARGLSVNFSHNLVVACEGTNKLQEYTTHGSLVGEICLQAGVTSPWHAIQLSTGDYVVSQYTSPGVVSVVGVDGQVVHSYGQSQTSDVGQMKHPSSLAVTKNNNILVTDWGNNRILSINRSTGCVQELALSVDGGIHCLYALCVWTSLEVDFTLVNWMNDVGCWSLMVLDCNLILYRYNANNSSTNKQLSFHEKRNSEGFCVVQIVSDSCIFSS